MTRDELLRRARIAGPLTERDKEDLREVLESPLMLRALGELVGEMEERRRVFVGAELTTEEGRARALRAQGTIVGLERALEKLFSMAEITDDE